MREKATQQPPARNWAWPAALGALILAGVLLSFHRAPPDRTASPSAEIELGVQNEQTAFAAYGKSTSCQACHQQEYSLWRESHHGLAERNYEPARDAGAFTSREVITGSVHSETHLNAGQPTLVTLGTNGPQEFTIERVIGENPLRQFLVAASGGRYQATELAFDPARGDWFDVFGKEDRRPGEWGHWTGRGMTWNQMCAACHNTRLRKNYQETEDRYRTTMVENGVGCEACHGPMAAHDTWQQAHPHAKGDPTIVHFSRDKMLDTCGSCHARRAELTGDFRPGESFFDHYLLSIPDETELFYADGQIREEDYELTAFLGSRMAAVGVRCVDCHEPHSARLKVPGNQMCLTCHLGPVPPAPKIDPSTHSHHTPGTNGDNCVDCHMPQTTYMQRHARHDHGFTIPDPKLTQALKIPNACNRCHADKDPAWSEEAIERWYGPPRNRPAAARARAIAAARASDAGANAALLEQLGSETNSFWKAVLAGLLRRGAGETKVNEKLVASAKDPHPLVRAMAVHALEPLVQVGDPAAMVAAQNALSDSSRAVRLNAAWALHPLVATNNGAGRELLAYLAHNADQPQGAMQFGVFSMDRGEFKRAEFYFARAASWETNSAPPHQALAVALSLQGRTPEAVAELQTACKLAPGDVECRYRLGLALNESGDLTGARTNLEFAVQIDPRFAPAWYNLGLAQDKTGEADKAVESLLRAESLDANSAQIPYARATVLLHLGRRDEARAAARRAVEIQPNHAEANALLQSLDR